MRTAATRLRIIVLNAYLQRARDEVSGALRSLDEMDEQWAKDRVVKIAEDLDILMSDLTRLRTALKEQQDKEWGKTR